VPNLHPILVHFTIGLFVISVIFDILAHFTYKKSLDQAGWWNLVFSAAFSIVTVASGLSAEDSAPHVERAHKLIELHKTLGLVTMGIILILVIWRGLTRTALPKHFRIVYLALGLAGLTTITFGGYIGGEMVYRYGVAIAPISEQLKKYESPETDPSANIPIGKYYCPMHPNIISDTAGVCPECGMSFVQKESGASGHLHHDGEEHHDND
jgi:uncharacterized membrane protein